MRIWIAAAIAAISVLGAALLGGALPGCTGGPQLTVRERMEIGDRYMDWGMVYYNSWLRDHNQQYLDLARQHTQNAVISYFQLQLALGHSYPDFYILDTRRLRGCRFLREIDGAAQRNRVELDEAREGCLK
jgi:hypothetical protein